jgi:hypothetical protein
MRIEDQRAIRITGHRGMRQERRRALRFLVLARNLDVPAGATR